MRNWQTVAFLGLFNYLLLIGVNLVSDAIAPWSIALHAEVLLLVFPALMLRVLPGLSYCLLIALLLASLRPLDATPTLISILLIYHLLILFRGRLLPRNLSRIGIHCAALQLANVLFLSLWFYPDSADVTEYWIRCLSEGALSALFVGAFSGLWFHWQGVIITEMGQIQNAPANS
jgi:hypothetical protein